MELKYQKVINHLIRLFTIDKYIEGDKLPTEMKLMKDLQVGRNTIRKAIMVMETDGIVIRKQGSGTFYVRHDKLQESSGGLIGLANFHVMEYIYPEIIKGVEDALYDEGYSLVIASSNKDPLRDSSALKIMLDQGLKGLIFDLSLSLPDEIESPMIEVVKSARIPVITTHWNGSVVDFSGVSLDDEYGGYKATSYLLENGHRDIAIIYKSNVLSGCQRHDGYCRAFADFGIETNNKLIFPYDDRDDPYSTGFGYKLTKKLLDSGDKFTAVFYFNDMIAMEGYKEILSRGIKIPEDISVIGFDNYKYSESLSPPLTTMAHPKKQLGYWAAKLLLNEIQSDDLYLHKSLVFKPILVVRDSVQKLNS